MNASELPVSRSQPGIASFSDSDRWLRTLTDALPQMVWVSCARDGHTLYANEHFRTAFGSTGNTCADHIAAHHPDDRQRVAADWAAAVATRSRFETEARLVDPAGVYRWHKIVIVPVRHGGDVAEWIGTALDIEDIITAREACEKTEERLAHALDAASDGFVDCDLTTGRAWVSDRYWMMLGYEPGDLEPLASTWRGLLHPADEPEAMKRLRAHLDDAVPLFECEHRLRRRDGSWGWFLTRGRVVSRNSRGSPLRYVGTHMEIDARKAAEQQIVHMARHDALTGLPNRVVFRECLERRLTRAARGSRGFALLYLDLDRFKVVNDTLGHAAGDALLNEASQRMRGVLGPGDMIARLGGDEFAILLGRAFDEHAAMRVAGRLLKAMSIPVVLAGRSTQVGISIGIALASVHGHDADSLLAHADVALYRAKIEGRGVCRIYAPAMDDAAAEQQNLELDLHLAVSRNEFVLYYQPIVSTGDGRVVGHEALVRWRHPRRGLIPPAAFIPLAEKTGLIAHLGTWVLKTACRDAQRRSDDLRIAVNVSPEQVRSGQLPETVRLALNNSGLRSNRLEIEITEGVLMQDAEANRATLHSLRALGTRIVLDDFGTGYSSLSYLRQFPFDKIKIDRSFIADIENPNTAAIVSAVVGIGKHLDATITAEGVEEFDQIDAVRRAGCDEAQGYAIGFPEPFHFTEEFSVNTDKTWDVA